MLRLYHHPLSTFTRRVRIALLEKHIAAELVEVDLAAREHRGPKYLALNPYGRVPTLQDGDFVLYESTAILEYLEATHPEPALAPADPQGRALVSMHMKLCDLQMSRHTGTIIFAKRFLPRDRWDEPAMAQAKREIEKHLGILEMQLQGTEYLVANCYTLAEVCYTPFVDFLPLMEINPPPGVAAWVARMLGRASAQATRPPR
jgi:glutathione S-transferase